MSKYFAGIEPLEKGYDVVSIKPNFGKLTKIESEVDTIKGKIKLDAEKDSYLKIETPSKTRVAIPRCSEKSKILINNKVVYENNEGKNIKKNTFDSEDENYIYYYVEPGKYEIKMK